VLAREGAIPLGESQGITSEKEKTSASTSTKGKENPASTLLGEKKETEMVQGMTVMKVKTAGEWSEKGGRRHQIKKKKIKFLGSEVG